MFKFYILFILSCGISISLLAQKENLQKIATYTKKQQYYLLQEYRDFLAIPNTQNDPSEKVQTADFIIKMMKKRGIEGRLLQGISAATIPAVFGEVKTPGATTTIIFYAHYDGQPVTPSKWAEGLHPFKPRLATASLEKGGQFIDFPKETDQINPDWRLYARSAADDKAGVFTILNAYDALRQSGIKPTINIKFFFEGEEEQGSTHLEEILEKNKDLLGGDLWIISDGPMAASGANQVVFGVRGDVNMDITVYGAKRPLHSGNYGNWAPNPAMKLVQLLASMKDTSGRVIIDGFYDDVTPLSASEKAALAAIPDPAPTMQRELAFAQSEMANLTFLESISTIPTLNINGISSADVGKFARNIIPATATATLDLRLVKGNDVNRQINKVITHIKKQGFYVIDHDPTDEERFQYPNIAKVETGVGYNAQRTPMDLPIAQKVVKAVQGAAPQPLVLLPSAGGSLPLYIFEKVLHTPPITIPVVNYDNNQHGENENVRIGCLFENITTIASIMIMR